MHTQAADAGARSNRFFRPVPSWSRAGSGAHYNLAVALKRLGGRAQARVLIERLAE